MEKKIFKMCDGQLKTQEALYWDFIRSIELTNQYELWHTALVDEELFVHT